MSKHHNQNTSDFNNNKSTSAENITSLTPKTECLQDISLKQYLQIK